MAAKGTQAKAEVTQKLLEVFGDRAFLYNDGKEIRINCTEAGELVQIKVALTAAKVAVEKGGDVALPGATVSVTPTATADTEGFGFVQNGSSKPAEPTELEKHNVAELMKRLGL